MIKIALLGLGTVGSGIAELLDMNAEKIAAEASDRIEIKYILTRRPRPDSPWADRIIQTFDPIEADPEIEVVVECMGGTVPALDYARRALGSGKHFVTSNKELVAEYGHELMLLAAKKNRNFLFEGSVGGGVPVIRPMSTCLGANHITELCGIVNGTSNFILTKMFREGLPYGLALQQARDMGYAEADPTDDVEGIDACRKTCILATLAYGFHVYPRSARVEGITSITAEDVAYGAAAGCRVKLLGRAVRLPDGRVSIAVEPHMVREGQMLACVENAYNGIVVRGDAVGEVVFYGKGAGKLPTASAVMSDIIESIRFDADALRTVWNEGNDALMVDPDDLPRNWYMRFASGNLPTCFGPVGAIRADGASGIACFAGRFTRNQIRELCKDGEMPAGLMPVLDPYPET